MPPIPGGGDFAPILAGIQAYAEKFNYFIWLTGDFRLYRWRFALCAYRLPALVGFAALQQSADLCMAVATFRLPGSP